MTKQPDTYAEIWAKAINETYDLDEEGRWSLAIDACQEGEDPEHAIRRILTQAANALRHHIPDATFTGPELNLVRHLMPAHEVHQSGSKHWVVENYGPEDE